jgi:hypothetical protein
MHIDLTCDEVVLSLSAHSRPDVPIRDPTVGPKTLQIASTIRCTFDLDESV